MPSRAALARFKKAELVRICEENGLPTDGVKDDLIDRICELNESCDLGIDHPAETTTHPLAMHTDNSAMMFDMMTKMMESQNLTMKQMADQQAEDRRLILHLLNSQEKREDAVGGALRRSDSEESIGADPKAIKERVAWLFKDIQTRVKLLEKEMSEKDKVFSVSLKDTVKSLQRSEEKLCDLIGDKLSFLNEGDSKKIEAEFEVIKGIIFKSKVDALKMCDEEEEAKKAGGLPAGIEPPNFYGDSNKYPIWWESFNALVHENKKVSTFYKYRYLRQVMKGDAEYCLNGFSPLIENYDKAIEHVKARYGQPRKVVRHIMKSIIEINSLVSEDHKHLRNYYDTIVGKIYDLKSYASKLENPVDAILIPLLESKLTKNLKQSWEKELISSFDDNEFATLERYVEWCLKELRAREVVSEPERDRSNITRKSSGFYSSQALPSGTKGFTQNNNCWFCNKVHKLEDCIEFKNIKVDERWEFAKKMSLCFVCFERLHFGSPCLVYRTCNTDNCNRRHHPLLHYHEAPIEKINSSGNCSTIRPLAPNGDKLVKIMPSAVAFITNGTKSRKVRIAFDTMCQDTFISDDVVKKLNLKFSTPVDLEVTGFGGERSHIRTGRVNFFLSPTGEKNTLFPVDALVKKGEICTPLEAVDVDFSCCHHLKGLRLADTYPREEAKIDILIGLNHYLRLVSGEIVRHPQESEHHVFPVAMKTVFGYVLLGQNSCSKVLPRRKSSCLFIDVKEKSELELDLQRFWEIESIGLLDRKEVYTAEEQQAIKYFEETIKYTGSRYRVGLPFKSEYPPLHNNYATVKKQLESIENRMKIPEDREGYEKSISDYVTQGFAREATQAEITEFSKGEQYFVPHHVVVKQESLTTKRRVVFNASSPDRNGNSLNDCLLSGPALQPDLLKILLRFRTKPVALLADIQKMFCQTEIDPKDYRFQQYLWRHFDQSVAPTIFIMIRLMFGVKPSPFLAMNAIKYHVSQPDMQELFPKASKVANELYVDDLCSGGDNDNEVIELVTQLTELLQLGGWRLTKFISNSKVVMHAIPEEDRLDSLIVPFEENDYGYTKALGIGWDVNNDCFIFQLTDKHLKTTIRITKRAILSKVFQVFDVFGFYAPFIIRMKILLQELWKLKVGWDDLIAGEIAETFSSWEQELKIIDTIRIPRVVIKTNMAKIELHAFADASEKAYGVTIYIRSVDKFGKIDVRLLNAKTRVAPLRFTSLPRLELLSAHAASKLIDFVVDALQINIDKIQFWLDSEIALCWISKPSSNWKTFVSNRVQEIHDRYDKHLWTYVKGSENPADLVTRGLTIEDIQKSRLYWSGPEWLALPETEWPSYDMNHEHLECEKEVKSSRSVLVIQNVCKLDLWNRFEKYLKIIRIVAQILKWNHTVPRTTSGILTATDLEKAENRIFRHLQLMHFSEEYDLLSMNIPINRRSAILSLDPIFDFQKQLIVVGGRLQNACLPEETKHQIILPCKDILVEKLILHIHVEENHSPIETTLCILRQRYWIIHGRTEVIRVIHKCLGCRHHNTVPLEPKMGNLPPERIQIAPAFVHIGLDFTGPIYIKEGKKSSKGYIVIFTCANSRMVHFELTMSMETEEFISALKRMMNRRGICRTITSDNQSTFKKASKIIQSLDMSLNVIPNFDYTKFEHFCTNRGIKWMFITERSPFRGGYWERLNRSLKEPLRKVLGRALLNYSEMYTVLTDIESSINQRPLTYQGSDAMDLQAITPAHLALGRSLGQLPNIQYRAARLSERLKYLQELFKHFWKRWTQEYLPCLQVRNKWKQNKPSLEVNDIVLISEDNVRRGSWPLGRVIKVIKGNDGVPRTACVQTQKGKYTRPFQRLHLFEKFVPGPSTSQNVTPSPDEYCKVHFNEEVDVLRDDVISQEGEDVIRPQTQTRSGRISKRPDFLKY